MAKSRLGMRANRQTVCSVTVAMIVLLSGNVVRAGEPTHSAIELYGSGFNVSGGSVTTFDKYRGVSCIPQKGLKPGGGVRAGVYTGRYFGFEWTFFQASFDMYLSSLHDSRFPPDPPDEYDHPDYGATMMSNRFDALFRFPLRRWIEPYVSVGGGFVLGEYNSSGTVIGGGAGMILYPLKKMGIRFEAKYSRLDISGWVEQDKPRRKISFDSKLTTTEFNIGLIFRFIKPEPVRRAPSPEKDHH